MTPTQERVLLVIVLFVFVLFVVFCMVPTE